MSEPLATFAACLPDVQSAVSVGGDGSVRVKLDVPASDLPEILKLVAFGRERLLRITVTGE